MTTSSRLVGIGQPISAWSAVFDFGWFRVEGELARKRASIDRHAKDDIADQFLSELNAGLNRPSLAPDPGAPGLPALTLDDFQPNGTVRVGSAMVNAFLDVPVIKHFSIYAGAGVGRSFARGFGDSDGALARQKMIGARYSVTDRFDVGLKYRKFASGIIKLDHDPIDYAGNPDQWCDRRCDQDGCSRSGHRRRVSHPRRVAHSELQPAIDRLAGSRSLL